MTKIKAKIHSNGLIDAFLDGLKYADNETVYCEVSAVVYDGKHLIFANDKPIPNDSTATRSPIFFIDFADFPAAPTGFYTAPPLVEAQKFEAFTITPDGKYVIATTAFDRVDASGDSKFDNYNTLLMWPVDSPDSAKVISPSTENGVTSSVHLRKYISSILKTERFPDDVPYFKIESITAVPNNQILLGIREFGKDYQPSNFEYATKLISVSYQIIEDEVILLNDFQLVYDFDPSKKLGNFDYPVGLSSIEYDKFNDRLYLLTSYERDAAGAKTDEDIGAFLWSLPLDEFYAKRELELVIDSSTLEPIFFAHKAEGIAVINEHELIIVHDDDKITGRSKIENPKTQFSKKPHQFAYTIIQFVD